MGGGGKKDSLIWPIRELAAGRGVVFWPPCPEQGIQFCSPLSETRSEPVRHKVNIPANSHILAMHEPHACGLAYAYESNSY